MTDALELVLDLPSSAKKQRAKSTKKSAHVPSGSASQAAGERIPHIYAGLTIEVIRIKIRDGRICVFMGESDGDPEDLDPNEPLC